MATDLAKVATAVAERIQKGLPFTAFMITNDLRKTGASAGHDEVKTEVHRQFKAGQMANYNRDSLAVPGKTVKCFVYYPAALDPNDQAFQDYVFANGPEVSSLTQAAPAVATAPAAGATVDADDDEDDGDEDNL